MKRQKNLMLSNNHEIARQYIELQVIQQDYKSKRNEMEFFLSNASNHLCLSGYELIKKCYLASLTVISKVNCVGYFVFSDSKIDGESIVLKNKQDCCSCYISTAYLMQFKHHISINRQFEIKKIDKCWHQRLN